MWFKGCIHLHSTYSDGQLTPTEICNAYKDRGYDFIAVTDHNVITKVEKKPDKDFLVIENSVEFDLGSNIHIQGINLKSNKFENQPDFQKIIEFILSNGGIAIIAHPNYFWEPKFNKLLELSGYHGIEIFNSSIKETKGSPFALEKWDYLLSRGNKVWGFAVDDLHMPKEHLIFKGWIMVEAEKLTKKDIFNSITKGKFYSSTGVILKDYYCEEDNYYVNSENGEEVVFVGDNGRILKIIDGKKGSIEINKKFKYIRCEVRSEDGIAYTQPLFLDAQEF